MFRDIETLVPFSSIICNQRERFFLFINLQLCEFIHKGNQTMKKVILRLTTKISALVMMATVIGLNVSAAPDYCDDARAAAQLCLIQWEANGRTLETYPEYAQCRLDSGIDNCQ